MSVKSPFISISTQAKRERTDDRATGEKRVFLKWKHETKNNNREGCHETLITDLFASSMAQLHVAFQHGVNLWSCTQQFPHRGT